MSKIAFLVLLFMTAQARSEIVLSMDDNVYAVPVRPKAFAKINVKTIDRRRIKASTFLKVYRDGEGYLLGDIGSLPAVNFLANPLSAKVHPPEGCAVHPLKWLEGSVQVATFKTLKVNKGVFFFELPASYKIKRYGNSSLKPAIHEALKSLGLGSKNEKLDKCFEASRVYAKDNSLLAFVLCDDGKNEEMWIFEQADGGAWLLRSTLGLEENC